MIFLLELSQEQKTELNENLTKLALPNILRLETPSIGVLFDSLYELVFHKAVLRGLYIAFRKGLFVSLLGSVAINLKYLAIERKKTFM